MVLKKLIPEIKNIANKFSLPHFIHGDFVDNIGSKTINIINPINNESLGNLDVNDNSSCNFAIKNCLDKADEWSSMPVHKRVDKLINFYDWINTYKNQLAFMISEENGKTINDAVAELERGLEVVQYSLSAPTLLKGEHSIINNNLEIHTKKQPIGITAGIMPFNFPGMIPLWMMPLSLAAGNPIIIKSSEKCPYTPLCLAYLAKESGIPDGVFNVIHGNKDISNQLITSPDVPAISFVGSTPIGKSIYELATKHGKRTQINMGAKNHAVVMNKSL